MLMFLVGHAWVCPDFGSFFIRFETFLYFTGPKGQGEGKTLQGAVGHWVLEDRGRDGAQAAIRLVIRWMMISADEDYKTVYDLPQRTSVGFDDLKSGRGS